jgi:ABC-type branched-subunit amino acid transport system ATPase component
VGRALASGSTVVLLDEPAAGLDSSESIRFADILQRVREADITILMVDHDMDLVLGVCDRVIVLSFGEILTVGSPAEVRADEMVRRAYLGEV